MSNLLDDFKAAVKEGLNASETVKRFRLLFGRDMSAQESNSLLFSREPQELPAESNPLGFSVKPTRTR